MALKEQERMHPEPSGEPRQPGSLGAKISRVAAVVAVQARNTLNPRHHLEGIKKDLGAFLHAVQSVRRGLHEHDQARLDELFHGRLMIAFYLSGPFNMIAVVLTQILQYALSLPESFLLLPIVANLLTGFVFQLVWLATNAQLYRQAYPRLGSRIAAFERDLWPVHLTSIQLAAAFWVVNIIAVGAVVEILRVFAPAAAHAIPWATLATIIEFIVVAPGFVRNIGDFFNRYAATLAIKYQRFFEQH